MSRTARALFMAGVLALTVGVAAPAQAGTAQPVPIKGSEETTGSWVTEDPGCPDILDFGFGLTLHATTVGRASHIGRYTTEGSWCLEYVSTDSTDYPGVVAVTWAWTGIEVTKTAANGDAIEMVGVGDFTSTWYVDEESYDETKPGWTVLAVESAGTLEIVGGTGRFTDASGSVYATESSATGPTATFRGEISYDASNRAAR